MDDRKPPESPETDDWMKQWFQAAAGGWGELAKMWAGLFPEGPAGQGTDSSGGRLAEMLAANRKAWEAAVKTFSQPAAMEALLKGLQTAPDLSLRFFKTGADSFLELQRRWIERLKKTGAPAEPYGFTDLDAEFLSRWTDIYKKEFQQFLSVPQLGLTRLYQEKLNQAIDKHNLFQAAMGEFMHLLFVPVEKSLLVMQEKLTELAEAGDLPEDSKRYYQMWIRILEGHYMTLFQSAEYTQTLARTLDALNQFMTARQEVLEDALKLLPVATHRDMDEINREIYLLKRRLRLLEKQRMSSDSEPPGKGT
jgi:class III poly(R)-hydroxyalkanoic acid synthase PhaE subunit